MAQPEADGRDVYEAEEALSGLVVPGCDLASVLQFIEAPFDQVAQRIQGMIHADAHFS